MPSVIQKRSYGSVKVFWLDSDLLLEMIGRATADLARAHDEVEQVILFGSLAQGRGTPSSDVDLLIILAETPAVPFLERSSFYQEYFEGVDLRVELFVYTGDEVASGNIPLVRTAIEKGKVLFTRE